MPLPPVGFLRDASHAALEELRLSALNRAANLSKMLKREMDAWTEEMATAMLVEWMTEHREELTRPDIEPKFVEFLSDVKKRA